MLCSHLVDCYGNFRGMCYLQFLPEYVHRTFLQNVPGPDDDGWWLVWNSWWNALQGKLKYPEKTCPSAALFTINPTHPDPGSNLGAVGGKQATNCGMAIEPIGSLLYLKESSTGPYPEPDQCSPYHPILSLRSILILSTNLLRVLLVHLFWLSYQNPTCIPLYLLFMQHDPSHPPWLRDSNYLVKSASYVAHARTGKMHFLAFTGCVYSASCILNVLHLSFL
jgi:hypothetical protein